ncbi:formate/nitrite transporter family protein [Alteromonas lipolytica]|uniref:Transporter (Formate/nitrite transporter family protein) n=1 Tax=Alteromonas lipolytica TaxID=1856405 RepID=A0A1E8FEL3_9ALTE|nr:formate/nitrite transporter family protein [Alteromonas lipolytica]OFI34028.1 transporter (formate/nitrite transporter family protein) [Alteromonas lipolytica]GGF66084.1 formate dehydrogenase [Alteromonas lipolytica]
MSGDNPQRPHNSPLTAEEEQEVREHQSLNSISLYALIHREGLEELKRPLMSLWWSGVAAGMGISTSVLAEGILHTMFAGWNSQFALENLGYTVGFVLVIMGRLQLFTENTLTVILPLLTHRSWTMLGCLGRLWGIVFIANMAGTLLAAFLMYSLQTVPPEYLEGMSEISRHYAELTHAQVFSYGVISGFLIAGIVWMKPTVQDAAFFVVVMFTYLIAVGNFTHVIAGSTELFLLVLQGEVAVTHAITMILATLLGNIAGGTGLFALLAHAQVAHEIEPD